MKILFVFLTAALGVLAQDQFIWEAEEVIQNKNALIKDKVRENLWTYWTDDADAERKWTGCGIVIRSPEVHADRKTPDEGAPPLHIIIPLPDKGPWNIELRNIYRSIAFSTDGKDWTRLPDKRLASGFVAHNGFFECWFDDMFANADSTGTGSAYLDHFVIKRTAKSPQTGAKDEH